MTARLTVRQPAGEGELFAPGAFDSQIGKVIPVRYGQNSDRSGRARVHGAEVVEDGRAVMLSVELLPPDEGGQPGPIGIEANLRHHPSVLTAAAEQHGRRVVLGTARLVGPRQWRIQIAGRRSSVTAHRRRSAYRRLEREARRGRR